MTDRLLTTLPRRFVLPLLAAATTAMLMAATPAHAIDASTPDGLIRQLATETLDAVKSDPAIQKGDMGKIQTLVEAKLLPHVDFKRLTAYSVGRFWRQATPEQQERIQKEFRTLLMRTYAGALSQVKDHKLAMQPLRAAAEETEVVVRTQVRDKGEPIKIEYRLAKSGAVWQIYDMNVAGLWMGDQYRSSFAQDIGANGIDGLIKSLAEKNAGKPAGK